MPIVLVVEDHDQIRVLAEDILVTAGHTTISAASVKEALAMLASGPHIDMVFTDLQLSGDQEGGVTVGTEATRKRRGMPVIHTSGRAPTDGMIALFAEPYRYLQKPYTADALLGTIENLFPPP